MISLLRHFINLILLPLPPTRLFWLRRALLRLGGVNIGDNASYCGGGWVYGSGELAIGDDSWLSPRVIIYSHLTAPIHIGSNCDIGPGVKFVTGSHVIGSSLRRAGVGTAAPILIENGCWIGAYSTILGGVQIGTGSVVAAGSVVTNDVPENVLVAGVPARIKRKLNI